jgi:hypothetical protein
MYTTFSASLNSQVFYQTVPTSAAQPGTLIARRKSPVLSRQELQRLILEMVD